MALCPPSRVDCLRGVPHGVVRTWGSGLGLPLLTSSGAALLPSGRGGLRTSLLLAPLLASRSLRRYSSGAFPVLGYVAQLAPPPATASTLERQALHLLTGFQPPP